MVLPSRLPTKSKRSSLDRHLDGSKTILLIAVAVSLVSACGCSGLITDSMTGNLLADRSILPPERSIEEAMLDASPEKSITIEDLVQSTDADFEVDSRSGIGRDAAEQTGVQKEPGFRFSQDLPDETAPRDEKSETGFAANDGSGTSQKLESPKLKTARSEITLVAQTQPKTAAKTVEVEPIKTKFQAIASRETKILSPLQPIIAMPEPTVVKTANEIKIAAVMPKLSSADLRQVTRSAFETPIMSAHESVDLTELELESALLKDQPETQPATASDHLSKTIQLLKESAEDVTVIDGHPGLTVSVQMLEMLQRKLDKSSISKWSMSVEEHEYWQQQLQAVAVMFDASAEKSDGNSGYPRQETAIRAIEHLDNASHYLRKMAGLRVRGGQLCSEIFGYGQYRELDSSRFQTGDRALVYVEIQNFSTQQFGSANLSESESDAQWVTRLQTSYKILDPAGRVVQRETYPVIEDVANQRRRDFYLHLPLTIADLPAGDYQLRVSVEDLGNSASATLEGVTISVTN